MRQAAPVTRTLTYPRRGLHGEVVHLIGLQIMSGELKPGDPLPPEDELISNLAVSRTVLREAVRVLAAKGLVDARPKIGHARAGSRRLEHPRPRRPQLARRSVQRQQAVRGDDGGAAGDRAARRATGGDEGDGGRDRRDRRGVRRHGGRRRRPGRVPRRRPALPRPDPRLVPQRAPRPPRRRPSRRAPDDVRAHDDAAAVAPPGAPPAQGDPRQHRRGRRGRRRDGGAHAHRRHRGGHPPHRPPGRAALEARHLRARTSRSAPERRRAAAPAAASTTVPGGTVFPAKPSQWYGTSRVARRSSASSTASAASMFPTMPSRLALRVAPVDREQRHVDAERLQGRRQLVRDDRVAGVVDPRLGAEDVADEARATADRAAVAVRILHRHAVERRHDVDARARRHRSRVVRVHGDDLALRDDLLDERNERSGRTTRAAGDRSRMTPRKRKIEMVEVLVGDQDAVDALGSEPERRRRDEPVLVRARPRVDDEARLSELDPEPRLPEPGQSRPELRRCARAHAFRMASGGSNNPMI